MRTIIVTGPYDKELLDVIKILDNDYVIGADSGALMLAESNIDFDLALGDFDSVTENELKNITKHAKQIKEYNMDKDYTDTYIAVKEALSLHSDEIIIYGGLGKRLDHTYANINLLKLGNICIVNRHTKTYVLNPGTYEIENKHKYISFFALEDVKELDLVGFQFSVTNYFLSTDNPLCISNELEGIVRFKEGLLLVIHQNE